MRLAVTLALAILLAGCASAKTPAPATGGTRPAAESAPAAGPPSGAACARFRHLAGQADATGTSEADMRRDLAAMSAVPAPTKLAALFREVVADDLAIVNGATGTIPGLRDAIRELNAACPPSSGLRLSACRSTCRRPP